MFINKIYWFWISVLKFNSSNKRFWENLEFELKWEKLSNIFFKKKVTFDAISFGEKRLNQTWFCEQFFRKTENYWHHFIFRYILNFFKTKFTRDKNVCFWSEIFWQIWIFHYFYCHRSHKVQYYNPDYNYTKKTTLKILDFCVT